MTIMETIAVCETMQEVIGAIKEMIYKYQEKIDDWKYNGTVVQKYQAKIAYCNDLIESIERANFDYQ
jgi:hypothetical protein